MYIDVWDLIGFGIDFEVIIWMFNWCNLFGKIDVVVLNVDFVGLIIRFFLKIFKMLKFYIDS